MKNKFFLLAIGILVSFQILAQQPLSEKAQVSLLTCEPGQELYAAFGHSAIRVKDSFQDLDLVFNYGVFDFDTEGFYVKFVKGETDYELGLDFAEDFIRRYNRRGSKVYEQVLDLSIIEKQKMFESLLLNYQIENRIYRYNYVYDNCATRPRKMIENVLLNDVYYPKNTKKESFRKVITSYVGEETWSIFGIDILIGAEADKIISDENRMFLPFELLRNMKYAKNSEGKSIVLDEIVYERTENPTRDETLISPLYFFSGLFILVALVLVLFRKKKMYLIDGVVFFVLGLLGLVVFYLTFYSLHPLVKENYNLLWVNPLYILFVVLLPIKRLRRVTAVLQSINALLILSVLILWNVFPQCFNVAFFPILLLLLMMAVRFVVREFRVKKQ